MTSEWRSSTGGSVDAVMEAAIGPYRKSRSRGRQPAMRKTYRHLVSCLLFGASLLCIAAESVAQQNPPAASDGVLGAMAKSLTGDVYGDPSAGGSSR